MRERKIQAARCVVRTGPRLDDAEINIFDVQNWYPRREWQGGI